MQGVFEALIRHDSDARPDGVWGDKSPNYRAHLPLLRQLWPEARFIHIIRDARDVCLSSHKAWKKAVLRNAQRWTDEVRACRRDGQALQAAARQFAALSDDEREAVALAAQRQQIEALAAQIVDAALHATRQGNVAALLPTLEEAAATYAQDETPDSPFDQLARFTRAVIAKLGGQPLPPDLPPLDQPMAWENPFGSAFTPVPDWNSTFWDFSSP